MSINISYKTYHNSYRDFVLQKIKEKDLQEPIYASEISHALALAYDIEESKAKAATAVAFKRIIDNDTDYALRKYKKGIYYRTETTPFGEYGIDKKKLIQQRYLDGDIGYETGYKTLHRLGLTTQIQNETEIATNKAKEKRFDKELGIVVRPPRAVITKDNLLYLKILDVMILMNKAPIDAEDPYKVIANYIMNNGLNFILLLGIASKFYDQDVLDKIAKTAERMINVAT